jgi:triosephosphate isomerase
MRKILVAGNWKLNTLTDSAVDLANGVVEGSGEFGDTEVLLCPPFIWLQAVRKVIKDSPVKLGGQNLFWEDKGAFTGEISGAMLKSAGCEYVIIGHSERRQYFGESDITVNKRLKKAMDNDLTPIICLGENLEQREQGQTETVITEQFNGGFREFDDFDKIVIAYEPVWAIGSGKTASPEQAQEIHQLIRKLLNDKTGAGGNIRILYGGSVKPGNADDLIAMPDIDGFLIGGASLKAEDFVAIIKATA